MTPPVSKQQFEQLPLFMQAKELHSRKMNKGDLDPELETHADLMREKAWNAESTGLTDDIREHGVKNPVWVDWSNRTLIEGHHRVAAAHQINPNMWLPVRSVSEHEYWDDPEKYGK